MGRLSIKDAELLAQKFRLEAGMGMTEPVDVKSVLRRFRILTMYRPLSENSFGISIKTEGAMFMMVNCNSTRGRQHFTVAHELYHLFYDENPAPHVCRGAVSGVEKDANLFASALLMPREGLLHEISEVELLQHRPNMATVLRLEQLFGVSRMSLLVRLKDMGVISETVLQELNSVSVKDSAQAYGYDTLLYESGNEGIVIGDFGEKAKRLFDAGLISEGHYVELLNMISDGRGEGKDCVGC
ncbi:MAG: ImmA/IrrE family metallo-endopeptidase [Bacteroidales bacterium]|nr:ImmA/IrrE family metallo-endopeptidase [Bacteroidales bacterium]